MSERILVAYDGSPAAERALRHAAALVGDGEVVLLRVLPAIVPADLSPRELDAEEVALEEAELERARERVAALGVRVRTLPVVGDAFADAATAIIETAEACGATVIALGTHHRGPIGRLVHGSVSSRVSHEAHCDVLVVR
jgi:nucleotide-binding universal stress UspA family protein